MLDTKATEQSDISLQKALDIIERQRRIGRASNIAVLGPPGSGKSLFLSRLLNLLGSKAEYALFKNCLKIDLRQMPIGELDEVYDAVNYALLQEARRIGIALDFDIQVRIPHLRFGEIIRCLVDAVEGHLTVFVDHLESVPRFFASDLNHRFRNFIEVSEQKYEYRRLGFIVAGAVSLFDLKQETDSAYSMFDLILLPDLEPEVCRTLVEDRLKASLLNPTTPQIIELLAKETSGEPGFLEPVIQVLKKNQCDTLNEELIRKAIDEICHHSQVPWLRHLALHLWADPELRKIVHLFSRSSTVIPMSVNADIDRLQLSGAVVLSKEFGFHSYRLRNEMVSRYLTTLLNALESPCPNSSLQMPILDYLMSLDRIKSDCLRARQIWKCSKYIREAWKQITRYSLPNICLYVMKHNATQGWWLDARTKEISGPEPCEPSPISTKLAAFSAVNGLTAAHWSQADSMRSFFCWDKERVSVGIPLSSPDVIIVVIATLPRAEVGNDFTEFTLYHWIRFVQTMKQSIFTLALAEMGKQKLAEPRAGVVEPPDDYPYAVAEAAAGKKLVKHLYWVPGNSALVCTNRGVMHFPGTIDQDTIRILNNLCRDLVTRWGDRTQFHDQLSAVALQFHNAIKGVHGLFDKLLPDAETNHLVITTHTEGLAIPFELLPHEQKYLALLLPLSRQLIDSRVPPKMSRTFHQLFSALVAKKGTLRVLLIASDAGGDLPDTEVELSQIRKHIQAGCDQAGLKVHFRQIPAAEATTEVVEAELNDRSPYHILHYAGHVRHHSESPDASGVVLRDEDNEPEVISCERLRHWTEGAGLWLAYLSACHSSAVSSPDLGTSRRYLGTIEALVRAGVPNVVGFRSLVSDKGALQLASEFYRQLFEQQEKKDLGEAMFKARTRLVGRRQAFDAWASSILVTQIV